MAMPIKNIWLYFLKSNIFHVTWLCRFSSGIGLVALCFFCIPLMAQTKSTDQKSAPKVDTAFKRFTYFRLGIDLSKVLKSQLVSDYKTYEFQADANFSKETSLAFEFGAGQSSVSNSFLTYTSRNSFMRLGLDKYFFGKEFRGDMDNAFVGIRYAISNVVRDEAAVRVYDPIWGNTETTVAGTRFLAHWIELTGGMRLEIVKNVFAGWNVRAKTFINPKKFELLPPAYLSGYGAGDKNTAFDYNFYLLYGIGKRR
jgi:hypothetical protein